MAMFQIFYSDVGYRRQVNSWNAADVLREDGVLQHGTVIDVSPDGLVVDFGCAGQRRQLVKYGAVFGDWEDHYPVTEFSPGRAVMVLLRDDPQSPWRWRPGTLVTAQIPGPDTIFLALVDVEMGGAGRRQVVDLEQVRPPPSPVHLEARAFLGGEFVVRSVSPPAADYTGSPAVWKAFCHHMSAYVWPMSVSSSELRLLDRAGVPDDDPAERLPELEEIIQNARESIDAKRGGTSVKTGWLCSFPLARLVEAKEDAGGIEWVLQDMPDLALEEMLTYLDTMQRACLRRVQRAFNERVLATLSVEIRLTYHECCTGLFTSCGSCTQLLEHYAAKAPLLQCVTARTRRICLINVEPRWSANALTLPNVLHTLQLCGRLGQCVAGQEVLVVANQCDVGVYDGFFCENACALATSMAGGWCKKLLLKQCIMSPSLPDVTFSGAVRGLRFSGSLKATKMDLWRLAESQLPAVDVQRVSEWVAQAVQERSPSRDDIARVLNEFTSHDPRPANAYANRTWTEDTLDGLDVTRLTRLAQYALHWRSLNPLDHGSMDESD